jgi:glutaminyl-peptide cyclotransferase
LTRVRRVPRAVAAVLAVAVITAGCGDDGPSALDAATSTTAASSPSSTATPAPTSTIPGGVERLRAEVIERHDSDPDVYTQGLELHDGDLYVSGGLYGESSVRIVDPDRGEALHTIELDDAFFGEGLTVVDDEVIVLTWKEGTAMVLDAETLDELDRFTYQGEGWGLCDDGDRLVMSDGSATLQIRDRQTFALRGTVPVTLEDQPLSQINELECVGDAVWANVWKTDTIVRIDPATGRVTATVDASALVPPETRSDPGNVLNGIAHDERTDTFLITGKRWPALFVVRFVPAG